MEPGRWNVPESPLLLMLLRLELLQGHGQTFPSTGMFKALTSWGIPGPPPGLEGRWRSPTFFGYHRLLIDIVLMAGLLSVVPEELANHSLTHNTFTTSLQRTALGG